MKISYNWLQKYFDEKLPEPQKLVDLMMFHSFEIDKIEEIVLSSGKKDTVIDADVLPNRAHDCLSHYGIAKEISVLTGLPLKKNIFDSEIRNDLKKIDIQVENIKDCRRYFSVSIEKIKVGPSPEWLKESLEAVGQRSINNVVDATNYAMFALGQPSHAFDKDKLTGEKIFIRRGKIGEKIITLDNRGVDLNEDILIVADEKYPLAIAGVKGGKKAEVDSNTENILLEAANFNPVLVRRVSRSLGILTDSSKRFENEITTDLAGEGMFFLINLILEIAGGNVVAESDFYPRKPNIYKIGIEESDVNKLLGTNFSREEIKNILKRLNFEFEEVDSFSRVLELATSFLGVPYQSGASITYDAPRLFDCSSFVAYLFAQAGFQIPRISVDQYVFGEKIDQKDLRPGDLIFSNTGLVLKTGIYKKTVEFLPGTDVSEGIDHVGLYLGENKLIHTSSQTEKIVEENLDEAEMFKNIVGYRRIITDETIKKIVVAIPTERIDLRIKEDLIEEIGRIAGYRKMEAVSPEVFSQKRVNKTFYYTNKIRQILNNSGFTEVYTYVFGGRGGVEVQKPLAENLKFLRLNLTDGLEKSLDLNLRNAPLLGLNEIKIFEIGKVFPTIDNEVLFCAFGIRLVNHNMKSVVAIKKRDELIKETIDILNKELNLDLQVKEGEGIFEINLDELIEKLPEPRNYENVLKNNNKEIKFKTISAYPFALRDISVWVPKEIDEEFVLKVIKENAGELLVRTKLFDVFEKSFEDGSKKISYAFNLVFQSFDRTLNDEEINQIMSKIYQSMMDNGWEIR